MLGNMCSWQASLWCAIGDLAGGVTHGAWMGTEVQLLYRRALRKQDSGRHAPFLSDLLMDNSSVTDIT